MLRLIKNDSSQMDEKKPVQKNENAIEKKKEKQRVCWGKKKNK